MRAFKACEQRRASLPGIDDSWIVIAGPMDDPVPLFDDRIEATRKHAVQMLGGDEFADQLPDLLPTLASTGAAAIIPIPRMSDRRTTAYWASIHSKSCRSHTTSPILCATASSIAAFSNGPIARFIACRASGASIRLHRTVHARFYGGRGYAGMSGDGLLAQRRDGTSALHATGLRLCQLGCQLGSPVWPIRSERPVTLRVRIRRPARRVVSHLLDWDRHHRPAHTFSSAGR